MKRKGIAFMDDLIDNLITFLLIIIVFVMIFFVTSAAQKKTERTYEETSYANRLPQERPSKSSCKAHETK